MVTLTANFSCSYIVSSVSHETSCQMYVCMYVNKVKDLRNSSTMNKVFFPFHQLFFLLSQLPYFSYGKLVLRPVANT